MTPLRGAATFLFDARGSLWIANDYYAVDHASPEIWSNGPVVAVMDHFDTAAGMSIQRVRWRF